MLLEGLMFMKEIIYNDDNLKDADINNIVKRAKLLIINSNDEILLACTRGNYHIVGGHVENNESYDECIIREVKEETGIILNFEERIPYLVIKYMCKDYPEVGKNSLFVANYYVIKTDLKPNLDYVVLTDDEREGNFQLKYIHKNEVIKFLYDALETCSSKNVINDTIEAIKEYLNICK